MADLTQDQLAQLMQMYRTSGFSSGANIGGQYLAPIGVQGAGEDNGMNTLQGFTGFDPQTIASQQAQYGRIMPNTSGSIYGTNGGYGGDYKTQDDNPDGIQKAVLAAILAASAGAATGAFGGGAGAESAGMSGMDLAADGGANSVFAGSGATGGFLGDATSAGYDPFYGDTFSAEPDFGASGELSKASLDGTNSFGANSAGLDTNPGGLYNVGAGAYGGGGIPSVTVNAATGAPGALTSGSGSWWGQLTNMLPSGAGSLIAPLLGGIVGSQPQTKTDNSSKTPWAPLIPYLTGQGGLFDSAQKLAQTQSTDPGWNQMKTLGQSMMQAPAANGYSMFANNKVNNPVSNWAPLSGNFSNPFINWARPGSAH